MAPPLKVFETQIGVSIWVVAVSSQKAALKAWDVRENLFAQGAAKETKDPAAIALALKHPGAAVVLRNLEFRPEKGRVAKLDDHRSFKPAKREEPKRAPPDRTQLDAAERAMHDFAVTAKKARADISRRQRAFEAEIEAELARLDTQEKSITARLEREQRAFAARSKRD